MKYLMQILLFTIFIFAHQSLTAQCTVEASADGILTCVNLEVALATTNNAIDPSYEWAGPGGFSSNNPTVMVAEPGTYSVTLTDNSNGCTAVDDVDVQIDDAPPAIAIAPDTLIDCNVSFITLNATAGGQNPTFSWTGPNNFASNTANPTITEGGTYTLVVTDAANGCTATDSIQVTKRFTPFVQADPNSILLTCGAVDFTLSVNTNAQNPDFLWIGPVGFQSFNQTVTLPADPVFEGTFLIDVTDLNSGCTGTDFVEVIFNSDLIVTGTVEPTCENTSEGSIMLDVTGGVPPYDYAWSNGATAPFLNDLPAGTYCVTVTDQGDCSTVECFTVLPFFTFPYDVNVFDPILDLQNGSISISPLQPGAPLSYLWSTGDTSSTLMNLDSGTYCVTITDQPTGCESYECIELERFIPQFYFSSGLTCNGTTTFQVVGGVPPYTLSWLGPVDGTEEFASAPISINLPPGEYTVILIDAAGQAYNRFVTIEPNPDPCSKIFGSVRVDEDLDCQNEPNEPGVPVQFIEAYNTTDTFYAMTAADGHYTMEVLEGDYTVRLLNNIQQGTPCTNSFTASIPNAGDSVEVNYSLQLSSPACPQMEVTISTPFLRRCFNSQYLVQYFNSGLETAEDAYVDVFFDPFLEFQFSLVPFQMLGPNEYRFFLGDVPPVSGGTININVKVSCNAVLGQTHCTEARIYPDTLCVPADPNWSGALLNVEADCDGDTLRFEIQNVGTAPMSELLDYIVIEDQVMYEGQSAPLGAGASMFVNVPANGSTWRLEVEQEPFAPVSPSPALAIEGCVPNGQPFSVGMVNQFSLDPGDPWVDVNCTENIGAYDPNDKQGFPRGYGNDHYIRPGTELTYLIRFQNTGTDTAFNVVIRDTLSSWFDITSVRPGPSSHNYTFEVENENVLIFEFENILLPDSSTNLEGSNGYVEFAVLHKSDAPLQTDLLNSAAIYFDFNDPIITNTTQHRLGENFVTVSAWQPVRPQFDVLVTPNPIAEEARISLKGIEAQQEYHLRVFVIDGRLVSEQTSFTPWFTMRRNDLPGGVYGITIDAQGQLLGSGKLIIE